MAHSEIAPDKIAAYHSTLYRVGSGAGAITLGIGIHAPQLHSTFKAAGAECGVVITAFNPLGGKRRPRPIGFEVAGRA